ncbi:MAG TPA: hypothetical protein VFQ82_11570, partial [Stellaceae bacterium]|nr:hypothetical protein [Stellaceae bacterium]
KIVKRLSIEPERRRSSAHRGQSVSYITTADGNRVLEYLRHNNKKQAMNIETQSCVFYLLLLEPTHDPGRFKVGIADTFHERLRQLRCSAPLITVVNTWPCRRMWEKTAIDCVTEGCERLHTEVFRTQRIEKVVEKCEQFFELMPKLSDP